MRCSLLFAKLALLVAGVFLSASPAAAALIVNGDFSTNGGRGQVDVNTTIASWTGGGREGQFGANVPPVFLFNRTAGNSSTGDAFMGTISFWVDPTPTAPTEWFVALDGSEGWDGSIEQSVSGLTIGTSYTLTFNWAATQQTGYYGPTSQYMQVTFGDTTATTPTVQVASQSWTGWQSASMSFTASSTQQVLKFLAVGTPSLPPWMLLSSVDLTTGNPPPPPPPGTVPEPASMAAWLLIGSCLGGCWGVRKAQARRRAAQAS